MKQDKFLIGILIGIGVLIVVALTLFFVRQNPRDYLPEDNPSNVTHNYALAVFNGDYQKAYGYLADLDHKPTYEEFRKSFFSNMIDSSRASLSVGDAMSIDGDDAIVNVTVYYPYNDPFSSNVGTSDRATLLRQNGAWKLTSMPYLLWDWNWYQEQ